MLSVLFKVNAPTAFGSSELLALFMRSIGPEYPTCRRCAPQSTTRLAYSRPSRLPGSDHTRRERASDRCSLERLPSWCSAKTTNLTPLASERSPVTGFPRVTRPPSASPEIRAENVGRRPCLPHPGG